jgi:hypothetical protein
MSAITNNKNYDGLTTGTLLSYSLSGIITGDIVDISNIYQVNFSDIYIGNNKTVYVTNLGLYGSSYYNYYILEPVYSLANILGAGLQINWIALGKVYDRNNFAPLSFSISGVLSQDLPFITVFNNWISLYRSVNAGKSIPIDISNITLSGSLANNYSINSIGITYGEISKRYLYSTGNDKTYDSKIVATLTISNLVGSDNVYYFANFDNKNVGINKLIYLTLSGIFNNNIFTPSSILSNNVILFKKVLLYKFIYLL